jgi:hypothetical protein
VKAKEKAKAKVAVKAKAKAKAKVGDGGSEQFLRLLIPMIILLLIPQCRLIG